MVVVVGGGGVKALAVTEHLFYRQTGIPTTLWICTYKLTSISAYNSEDGGEKQTPGQSQSCHISPPALN